LTVSAVNTLFGGYRAQGRELAAQDFAVILAHYWMADQSWVGVNRLFTPQFQVKIGGEPVYQQSMFGQFMLVDSQNQVVGCAKESLLGGPLPQEMQPLADRYGVPVMVEEQRMGTLVPLDTADLTPLEEDFLGSVQRAALVGGAIALGMAAVLGAMLAWQLSEPLRRLIRATERIARGDLAQRVAVRTRDEIGRLGRAFNHMAGALERSETARKQLLADVTHELRTPLTVMQGNLEAILDGAFPLSAESLVPVYEETLLLGSLVEDLHVLTLAETGHLSLERGPLDVGEVVRGAGEAIRPAAQDAGIAVEVRVEEDLWAMADRRRIRQVLGNLLSNALRHSPTGGVISLAAQRHGAEIWVTVRDQGPGIPREDLPHIFERFYKVDKSRAGEGTGLGLAIAQELVRAHQGRIWAETDGGAVFTFSLPAVAPPKDRA
jgi:signal transduction histidine kinase